MKKSVYKDYRKQSDYFTDSEEQLASEIENVESQKKFLVWIQEFSKKIVVSIFCLYVIGIVFSLILVYLSFKQGVMTGIDTFISEINQTFREVVGGYIVKSAVENSIKIGGNYLVGIADARLRALQNKKVIPNEDNSFNDNEESSIILEDSGDVEQ